MATQLSIWLYRGHGFTAITRCVLPGPITSVVSGNYFRETSVKRRNKIVKEITQNVANVFSFYAIIAIVHVFFNALTFARSLGRYWKPRPSASVFNTSHGTWRMLMHVKLCLIPIFVHILSPQSDNWSTWISGRERMTVEKNFSWSVHEKMLQHTAGINLRPPDHQPGAHPRCTSNVDYDGPEQRRSAHYALPGHLLYTIFIYWKTNEENQNASISE